MSRFEEREARKKPFWRVRGVRENGIQSEEWAGENHIQGAVCREGEKGVTVSWEGGRAVFFRKKGRGIDGVSLEHGEEGAGDNCNTKTSKVGKGKMVRRRVLLKAGGRRGSKGARKEQGEKKGVRPADSDVGLLRVRFRKKKFVGGEDGTEPEYISKKGNRERPGKNSCKTQKPRTEMRAGRGKKRRSNLRPSGRKRP